MVRFTVGSIAVLCTSLLGLARAAPNPEVEAASCPYPVSVQNGGFESGSISPWDAPGAKLVSPGFNHSKYALSVSFPAANLTEWDGSQTTTGKLCFGYYYNVSYAWNWANYTGPEGNGDKFCRFQVYGAYAETPFVYHYATRTPGWHTHSYLARDVYSHCENLATYFAADVTCDTNDGSLIPAFTILIDNLSITPTNKSPNPKPSCN